MAGTGSNGSGTTILVPGLSASRSKPGFAADISSGVAPCISATSGSVSLCRRVCTVCAPVYGSSARHTALRASPVGAMPAAR